MRKMILVFTCIFSMCASIPDSFVGIAISAEKLISIHTYTGNVEVRYAGSNGGYFSFDMTMSFDVLQDTSLSKFSVTTQSLFCDQVQIDGKSFPFTVEPYYIILKVPQKVARGAHTVRIRYRCELVINAPSAAKLQLFANYTHMHCYQAWYPVIDDNSFAKTVKFDVSVTIPPDWHMIGGWVPKQYREKPKSDGMYRMVRAYENPYMSKLVAGDYNVYSGGNDKCKVWVYSLKTTGSDAQYYAKFGDRLIGSLTDEFGLCGESEYILAGQTGRAGNGQWIDGGFVQDQTYFFRQYNTEDIATHDIALAWVNGVLAQTDKSPDKSVLSDGIAQALMYRHVLRNEPFTESMALKTRRLKTFWDLHSQHEPPMTDTACSFNQFLLKTKAPLVFHCLEKWIGTEKFVAGLKAFFKRHELNGTGTSDKPSLASLKAMLEEAYNGSIDEIWNVYFGGGSVPVPQIEVSRTEFEGETIEKLKCKNLEALNLPIKITAFSLDGKPTSVIFNGGSQEFIINGGIAGFLNESAEYIIPKPGLVYNSLATGTIAAALAWGTPQVVTLESKSPRSQLWSEKLKVDVTREPDYSKPGVVIFVGSTAIIRHALESMKNLPVKSGGEELLWLQDKFPGKYTTLMVLPNVENSNLPIIVDNNEDNLPIDLSWSGIFTQNDGPNRLFFRNQAVGVVSPPKMKLIESGWSDRRQIVYDARIDLSLTNAQGTSVVYEGFDPVEFRFGRIEKTCEKPVFSDPIYIDFRGASAVSVEKVNRYSKQQILVGFEYTGKAKGFEAPKNLDVPKTVTGSQLTARWSGQTKFMYSLDGKVSVNWETGESLLLQSLPKGKHKLSIVFYHEGWLSLIHDFEFESGATPPKLEIFTKNPICIGGSFEIRGKTDPNCTLDPPATINPDGSFVIVITNPVCPESVKVTAKNKSGLESSQTILISKRITLIMHIGSSVATDEDGKSYTMPVPPQSVKGTTYVPMRFIGERLGARILWDDFTKQVTYTLGGTTVEIIIGKAEARVNGVVVKMAAPAILQSGRTLVPVRFVAEALCSAVSFDPATKKITIVYPK